MQAHFAIECYGSSDQAAPRLDQSIPASISTGEGNIYQKLTMGIRIALPPNPHPMDLFRGSLHLV